MKKPKLTCMGLLFVAIFAFSFGFAIVDSVQGGDDPCCYIPATEHCSEGIGNYYKYEIPPCRYTWPFGDCQNQVAPECW